jgi:hypothetical protein
MNSLFYISGFPRYSANKILLFHFY